MSSNTDTKSDTKQSIKKIGDSNLNSSVKKTKELFNHHQSVSTFSQ